ncbi:MULTISPECIES: hypothetical protein [unclassified Rhodanobacter]|uniref:Uncharacterized protein n=1 Tax=Rhodanobacter humi TaxID=1888173 RepID=A0ABV4ALN1_9GAMM
MNSADLSTVYELIRMRVNSQVKGACHAVSLKLPVALDGELAFYKLVNWGFAVFAEAARVPFAFLAQLPPRSEATRTKDDLGRLRTFLSHNLSEASRSDRKVLLLLNAWFRAACGYELPTTEEHFRSCCASLYSQLDQVLRGLAEACLALTDEIDGSQLSEDLACRVSVDWPAHRFDRVVEDAVARLGDPGLDLMEFRRQRLDGWRKQLALARKGYEAPFLASVVDRDLLDVFERRLPFQVQKLVEQFGFESGPLVASLLLLRRLEASTEVEEALRHALGVLDKGDVAN